MMYLTKPVSRVSNGLIKEAGKHRQIVITLKPPSTLGFRAKGCRKTYYLTAEACYIMAVKAELADQRRQKQKGKKHRKRGAR